MIAISTSQLALLKRHYKVAKRVQIKDSGGTWRNLSSLLNMDWVNSVQIKQDIDNPVATARIELVSGAGNLCISPLNEISLVNKLSGSYTPLIDIKREIKVEVQLVTDIKYAPSSWLVVFWGYTDSVEFNSRDNTVTINCRDLGARIQDTFIETERTYSNDTGTLVQNVMQSILNDNYLSDISLYTPTSPGWYVKKFKQDRVNVLDALQNLAKQIGYSVRYKYDNSTSNWRLTFYCPDRTKTTVDYTFETDKILEVDRVSLDISGIRNVISVWYGPSTNRQQYTASDSTSISKYGRRFMEIKESATSQIDTSSEATALANAILNDLKDPKAEVEVLVSHFPFAELGDLYRFKGGNQLFTSDMDLAVVGFTHVITEDEFTTSLICRGKPAGAYLQWHANNVAWTGAKDTIPPASPSSFTLTPISGGFNITLPDPSESDWDGYEIHVSETSSFTPNESTLKAKGRQTSFDITDLRTKTYYVKVISYDTSGNRSEPSNEASIVSEPNIRAFSDKVNFVTYFESLDGFSLAGNYELIDAYVRIYTPATQYSFAQITKRASYRATDLTWDKIRRFKTKIQYNAGSSLNTAFFSIGMGHYSVVNPTADFVGFRIANGYLSAVTSDGTEAHIVNLQSLTNTQGEFLLEALFIPNVKASYYVNGSWALDCYVNLPSGLTIGSTRLIFVYVYTYADESKEIRLSEWRFFQED